MSRHHKQLQLNLFSQNAFSENRTDSIQTSACNRRLTIIFIIVCSSKLGNANVGRMYNAIEEFIEEIKRFAKRKELLISIDALFNTEMVYWQSDSATPLDQYDFFSPEPGGEFKPSEVYTAIIQRLSTYETDAYAPVFYLFGGNLHPKITNAKYRELKKQTLFQSAIRNSVPLEDKVSDFYQSFASAPEHILTELTPECLKKGIVIKPQKIQAESTQKQTPTVEIANDAVQKNKKFEALYEDSKSQYLELYNKYQSVTNELKATKDNYENIKTELQDANKQIDRWQSASLKLKLAYDKLLQVSTSEIVKLKNNLNDSNTQIDALRDDNRSLQSDLKVAKDNYEKLQDALSDSDTQIDALRDDNQRLRLIIKVTKDNQKQLQDEFEVLNAKNNALKIENSEMQLELQDTKINNNDLQSYIDYMLDKNAKLKANLNIKEANLTDVKTDLNQLDNDLMQTKNKLSSCYIIITIVSATVLILLLLILIGT